MKAVFGKYIPLNTFIHKLDARLKLILLIMYIVTIFLSRNLVISLGILLITALAFWISTKKWKVLFSVLKTPVLIALFVFLINIFSKSKGTDLEDKVWYFWEYKGYLRITISYNIVMSSLSLSLRVYSIILLSSILSITTTSASLTKAIEFLIYPLKFLFIPISIISMIISISLRFIPTLLEEATRIMKAQASRGVDFKNGKAKERAKSLITLIIPLFTSSFSKAEDLSYAMETRGYDPYKARSKYKVLTFKWYDYLVFLFSLSVLVGIVLTIVYKDSMPFWLNYIAYFWGDVTYPS
ncbi:energy-coupling factor transporter transmembrane component T family protein [Mycoplasmopsis pulmonis]|uniref:energy-coupling factor transporter transmembrane component T family protein n=1 Tax=Mycoplasmopsis pulmonis TaxID=2107 RepID=UPI00100500D5|nr:energy-coupling factor transporter transmembrane protein EcfT [Mycoplasmopsis pulmonis]MDZ7293342.1 energy-coupling factor transporter transmembrane protein EcfT [Mycoplasmopsis pulmonis]VEU68151.1 Energy-coupling factor transporter transmembrane protein EcfT [Mycoplasmopsis pulmonis]